MDTERELQQKRFASAAAFESWLAKEHERSVGIWLAIAKKESGVRSVTYAEALDVALCFGWIDGQKDKLDDTWWLQRFTPRKPRSRWSKINCEKAVKLIEEGRMRPAGLRAIELARAGGRWQAAYDGQRRMTVPDDLQRALDGSPAAQELFRTIDGANRYAILYRVHEAKRPETRARRIAKFVEMLEKGERLHPKK